MMHVLDNAGQVRHDNLNNDTLGSSVYVQTDAVVRNIVQLRATDE